ncbi:MAG: type I-U CRISPR-associated protein Csx17 [Nitrospira sp.]|nr:type I-U CRISPR-associated protein Csx17 [Nitrospira sp.]
MEENKPHTPEFDWRVTSFEGSRREQLRRWAQLPLEKILLAIEEMQDIAQVLGAAPSGEYGEPLQGVSVKEPQAEYGNGDAAHDMELKGCTPEPLMAYLKALGILRLLSEQKDKDARGWWRNDVFWLRAPKLFEGAASEEAKRNALTKFFLEEYKPTPIVAPWAGGSGFFKKDNKKAVEELGKSRTLRVDLYAKTIQIVHKIIKEENVGDKPKDEDKVRLIRRYRRELPNEVVTWMDAAMVLRQDGQGFAPLLGTGGNDGRLDFTQNFMQRIVALGLHKKNAIDNKSVVLLKQSLFATPATFDKGSVGQFAPGRAGGPNATQGMEGDSTDNIWDFVLMMEGALLLAGAVVRRFGDVSNSRASFPFTVHSVASGFDSAATKDEAESRGEVWLPLWARPTSTGELRQLFGEGRAQVSGRAARDGTDFARAVAELGVDRGIVRFNRVGFLKRSGKAFFAAPLGRFEVIGRSEVHLLRQIDRWMGDFRWKCARGRDKEEAPKRILLTLNGIDSAIFEFCKYGGPRLFQEIIIALGQAERELAVTQGQFKRKSVNPISQLSSEWMRAADDGSAEFAAACALVSIHDPEVKIGPFRANLESVDWKKRCRAWAERDRAVVWNAGDLAINLADVLQRRMMDGQRSGCTQLPLTSRLAVSLDIVEAFLAGELDHQRISDLLWGLMLMEDRGHRNQVRQRTDDALVVRAYALLKLLFLPRPLFVEQQTDGTLFARLLRRNETGGVIIRPESSILPLLRAGRLGEACIIAIRRLRASGLAPMPKPIRGHRVRDDDWRELDRMGIAGLDLRRLAAALLIPITDEAVNQLVRLIVYGDETKVKRLIPVYE